MEMYLFRFPRFSGRPLSEFLRFRERPVSLTGLALSASPWPFMSTPAREEV
jgi:hypothetical protein